jgi:hypothetical protein
MASARVEFDRAGMSAVLVGPDIRGVLATVAEIGRAYAEEIAPRRSGNYVRSFEVRADTIEFSGSPRAAATLINTAGYAAAVEWGYGRGATDPAPKAHRVLGRTLDHLTELRP